ncbi:hypothetical protein BH23BAC3_BH23BAC3_25430 [soil metagenome]
MFNVSKYDRLKVDQVENIDVLNGQESYNSSGMLPGVTK